MEEDGSYSFEQVFIDINTIANVTTTIFTDEGDGLSGSFVEPKSCGLTDPALSKRMDKAVCMPRTSEMRIFGNYNLGYGSFVYLSIYPKCNAYDLLGNYVKCTED